MTTRAAAERYLQQHLAKWGGKPPAVHNPNDRPEDELPVIYGFNNGGRPGWYDGVLVAEDGTGLGRHVCSDERYMLHDLGIVEGARSDRHERFREHYPDGYRMEFVPHVEVQDHDELMEAIEKNEAKAEQEKGN